MADVPLILLGEEDTVEHRDELAADAQRHGCVIADAFGYPNGAAASADDLTEVDAIVAALGRAITRRMDIWVPFPGPDFVREQHLRRLSLVLQRHGLNLRATREVYSAPTDGGMNEIDYALRREVKAIDDLDQAALSAAGAESLSREIAAALAAAGPSAPPVVRRASTVNDTDPTKRVGHPMPPMLPAPTGPWAQRKPMLQRFARWLVYGCGVTQAATARVLNSTGQRTATGRQWQPATVSKLLNSAFDREARSA